MELPTEVVISGYVVLGGAIAWLARNQVVSQRRCEREGQECRANQAALDTFIRTKLLAHATEAGTREAAATTELARARHVLERVEKRLPPDNDQTPTSSTRLRH